MYYAILKCGLCEMNVHVHTGCSESTGGSGVEE